MSPVCEYCGHIVYLEPGILMIEREDGSAVITHEECYQLSGEDGGDVERAAKIMEEQDENSTGNDLQGV